MVEWSQNRVSANDFDESDSKRITTHHDMFYFEDGNINVLTQFSWGQVGDSGNTQCRGDRSNWDINEGLEGIFHTLGSEGDTIACKIEEGESMPV